ncbi:MAG: efflux RND transporter permease subunit [Armatimonadota bacterium]|jgi:HAE1 family hydrophobic/amphiphilic exporter-1
MWAFAKAVISRRVTVSMLILGIVVLGLVGFDRMPWEQMPDVDFPYVTVIVAYPGAGPEEIEEEVVRPLEDAVSVLPNVQQVSATARENVGIVGIEFTYEAETDVAAADVRDAVARVRGEFPADAQEPSVLKIDMAAMPVLRLAVSGDRSPRDLYELVDDLVRPRIGAVGGVASVSVTGGQRREIQVLADKDRLRAAGLSISGFAQAIQFENMDVPAGTIEEGLRNYRVRVFGRAEDLDTLRNLRIHTPLGGMMRVADLADVVDTVADPEEYTRLNSRDVVGVRIVKQTRANTIEVVDGVMGRVEELQRQLPDDIEFAISWDGSEMVRNQVEDVLNAIGQGTLLAALVVLLFLHNVRAMLIAALAIPSAMIMSFVLTGLGLAFTLNTITLMAMAISVGILIDNAVVVLENVQRHLDNGQPPSAAAINGWSEIGWAVMAVAAVDIAIFLPVAIMSGIVGQIMYPFALTIVAIAAGALLFAGVVTPMLAAWWFERRRTDEEQQRQLERTGGLRRSWNRLWGGFYGALDTLYGALERVYVVALRWAVAHPYLVLLIGYGALVIIAITIVPRLGAEFSPHSDEGRLAVTVEMPAGTRLDVTDRQVRSIEQRLLDNDTYPEIEYVSATVGSSGGGGIFGGGGGGANEASIDLTLYGARERREQGLRSDEELASDIRTHLADIPAEFTVAPAGGMGGGGAPIELELVGEDYGEITRVANELQRQTAQIAGLIHVEISARPGQPEIQINLDRERVSDLGLSAAQVGGAIRTSIAGSTDTRFRERGSEYDIRVQLQPSDRNSVEDVGDIFIGADAQRQPVRLADIAAISIGEGPTLIERRDRRRSITLTAQNPGIVQAEAQQRIEAILDDVNLGGVEYQWAGMARFRGEAFGELFQALALSILLIYIVTAALYNSVLEPLNVMLTVPLALIGAVIGLLVTGNTLNMVSMIGVIMLVGLVARNSIILIDYINTLRDRGMSRTEAILTGGPHRMKPILMTVFSTVLGVLPTALALSEGAEWRAPFAWVLIFGLIFGTTLSLLVVPASYCIWDRVGRVASASFRTIFDPDVSFIEEVRGVFRRLRRRLAGRPLNGSDNRRDESQ